MNDNEELTSSSPHVPVTLEVPIQDLLQLKVKIREDIVVRPLKAKGVVAIAVVRATKLFASGRSPEGIRFNSRSPVKS